MQTNHFGFQTVPWVGQSIAGLSPRGLVFDPRSVDVGFVANIVALVQVFSEYFCFPPSVSSHQCSILTFTYKLLLPKWQNKTNTNPRGSHVVFPHNQV